MRAQCTICSDLFDGEIDVAALVDCGHTFHDSCLAQWLNQSMTCPQCRIRVKPKKIVHRLFFDEAEKGENEATPSKLQNEVSTLKAALHQKDQDALCLQETTEGLQGQIKKLKAEKAKIDKALKAEKTSSLSLQKELRGFQQQQEHAEEAICEAGKLRHKLESLTTVQAVVQGLECDVQDMITSKGDVKTLATWCAVLKKELSSKKTECKRYKEQYDRINKENMLRKKSINEKTQALTGLRDLLKHTEEDVVRSEKEIMSLKKKMNHLQKAVLSPSSTGSSFAHRLINESPAPQPLSKKPRLSSTQLSSGHGEVDLDMAADLFVSDMEHTPSPAKMKATSKGPAKIVKISSAANKIRKSASREVVDISNTLPLSMNIFKSNKAGASSGFLKKGYNGLGGHEKFINPFARPSTLAKKPAKVSAKIRNFGPTPALPTMSMADLDS